MKRAIVQSSGEGLIWVCGKIRNGDLICTSSFTGYGMRQDDDLVKNISVAKATCNSKQAQKRIKITRHGKKHTCYLIGCIYLL